jgi:hypothetical protein
MSLHAAISNHILIIQDAHTLRSGCLAATAAALPQFTALQREVEQQEMLRVQLMDEALPEAVQKLVDLHDSEILKVCVVVG